MWRRYCRLSGAVERVERSADMRRRILVRALRNGLAGRWRWANALEAADLGMDEEYRPGRTRPTGHRRGSAGKLAELTRRIENGEELFDERDA